MPSATLEDTVAGNNDLRMGDSGAYGFFRIDGRDDPAAKESYFFLGGSGTARRPSSWCRIASNGWRRIILGPDHRITSRMRWRMSAR